MSDDENCDSTIINHAKHCYDLWYRRYHSNEDIECIIGKNLYNVLCEDEEITNKFYKASTLAILVSMDKNYNIKKRGLLCFLYYIPQKIYRIYCTLDITLDFLNYYVNTYISAYLRTYFVTFRWYDKNIPLVLFDQYYTPLVLLLHNLRNPPTLMSIYRDNNCSSRLMNLERYVKQDYDRNTRNYKFFLRPNQDRVRYISIYILPMPISKSTSEYAYVTSNVKIPIHKDISYSQIPIYVYDEKYTKREKECMNLIFNFLHNIVVRIIDTKNLFKNNIILMPEKVQIHKNIYDIAINNHDNIDWSKMNQDIDLRLPYTLIWSHVKNKSTPDNCQFIWSDFIALAMSYYINCIAYERVTLCSLHMQDAKAKETIKKINKRKNKKNKKNKKIQCTGKNNKNDAILEKKEKTIMTDLSDISRDYYCNIKTANDYEYLSADKVTCHTNKSNINDEYVMNKEEKILCKICNINAATVSYACDYHHLAACYNCKIARDLYTYKGCPICYT